MRSVIAAAVFTATCSVALPAQDAERSSGLCYRPRPRPRCHAFLLTNAGAYVTPTATNGDSRFRGVVDWGFMVNSGPRNAVGLSWFVSLDKDDFTSGPVIRYRRWLDAERSLEIALATPVTNDQIKPGSVLALVKYNPVHWAGVALRPEFVRSQTFACFPGGCAYSTANVGRLYAGVEVGEVAGLTLSLGAGVSALLLALALAGSD